MRQKKEDVRDLKRRMQIVASQFPFKDYTAVYQYEYGILTDKEKDRVYKCYNCIIADADITARFERLIENFKNG